MAQPGQIGRQTIDQVLAHPEVARALHDRAKRVLAVAQREAYRAGRINLGDQMIIRTGIRPGAKADGLRRPFARVESTLTTEQQAEDQRKAKSSRRQIMRRAARG